MSAAAAGDGYPIAPRLRGVAAFTLYLANLMVTLDMTVANVAVPHIAGNLGASLEQGTWVVTSYAVAEAITVPLTGWLVGRFGAVRLMVSCMVGFTFFSLMCGLSVTLPMLVLCRIGQGMSGGPIMSLVQTIITRLFPGPQLHKAFAIWTLTVLLGPALGPVVGGMIVDQWNWHWIFLINVPIGLVCAVGGYLLLRPAETERVRRPIDRIGVFLLVIWVGALQLMLDTGRDRDWFADPGIVALAIAAIVGFCAFVIWELTDAHPAVDLRLLRHRPFAQCILASSVGFGAHFCGIVVVPQWLQTTMGYSAQQAGMITGASAIGSILSTQLTLQLLVRVDARIVVTLGSLWAGVLVLTRTMWSTDFDFFHLMLIFGLQGAGATMMIMSLNTMSMNTISLADTAAGTGLLNFVRTMASAMATASMLTFWSGQQSVSRAAMAGSIEYGRVTDRMSGAGAGGDAGLAVISGLVDQQANTLAMIQTFWIAGIAMFVGAATVWTLPRIEMNRFK